MAQRGSRGIALNLSLTSALDGVGGQRHAPVALPPGKTWYPLYRTLGWPQGRSEQVRKFSLPPGFDPPTAQPVASRYTDYAIPTQVKDVIMNIKYCKFVYTININAGLELKLRAFLTSMDCELHGPAALLPGNDPPPPLLLNIH